MAEQGTLERLAVELATLLQPLEEDLAAGNVLGLFAELGLKFPGQLTVDPNFSNAISQGVTAVTGLPPLIQQLVTAIENEDFSNLAQLLGQLVDAIKAVIAAIDAVAVELNNLANALPGLTPADITAFAAQLTERLIDYLIVSYLEGYYPILLALLRFIGIVEISPNLGVPADPAKPPYLVRIVHFERVGQLFGHPLDLFHDLYKWGDNAFDGQDLLVATHDFLDAFAIPAELQLPPATATAHLKVVFFDVFPTTGVTPPGLEIELKTGIDDGYLLQVPFLFDGWTFELELHGAMAVALAASIAPPATVKLLPPAGQLSGDIRFRLVGAPVDPTKPFIVFGETNGPRLEAGKISLATGAGFVWDVVANQAHGDFLIESGITHGKLILQFKNADSFLSKILPPDGVEMDFDFGLGFSQRKGVYFTGSAALETNIGLHLSIGPFQLDSLHLGITAGASGLALESSITGAGVLGPVSASVERVGVQADLKFQKGNLGPVDLALEFKPPNGLGIVVDAGVVTGGGFITFDPPNGRYAGGIELSIEEITLKAFGLLDTKLPDGKLGFSFLILISAEFTPIQLGFGFTLDGVGGLAGINRTMVLDALQSGFRAHSIDSILFPDIHNAQKIISDLRAIFPPAEGRYVFGPMVEIGWGTPPLVAAQIGIIIEIPAPIRLAILGLIVAALPEDEGEDTVVLIHLEILGVVDFGLKKLAIDASIYDSRVVVFSLFGDMALRLSWGADATFAFSLGGLHPQYQPPPAFPHLRRLTLSIGDGDNPRMSLNTYMAVTSNTVQFGADLELYAAYGGFSAHGYLAFDALFIISPFSFVTEMRAGVDVKYNGVTLCGISLDFILTGPTPWTYAGTVTIHILFFDVSAGVSGSFGGGTAKPLPAEPVMTPLLKALNDARSWTAVLPEGGTRAVTFVTPKPDDKTIYIHPLGQLTVRQTVVPLGTPITKFGSAVPSDGDQFDITGATLTVATVATTELITPVSDPFARAQFEEMKDGDKLAAKSYEPFPSGVTLGDPAVESGISSTLDLHYDTQIIDDVFMPSRVGDPYHLALDLQNALCRQGAGELSPLRSTGNAKYKRPGATSPISVSTPGFVVTNVDDLSVRYDVTGGEATTQRAASVQLQAHVTRNPQDAGRLQVMPLHELVA